jgi:CBS-domain-containing membrane protein
MTTKVTPELHLEQIDQYATRMRHTQNIVVPGDVPQVDLSDPTSTCRDGSRIRKRHSLQKRLDAVMAKARTVWFRQTTASTVVNRISSEIDHCVAVLETPDEPAQTED